MSRLFENGSGAASRYRRACRNGEALSLTIPNAATHGPPTSNAVLVNLGKTLLITKASLLTELVNATASGAVGRLDNKPSTICHG